jgi:phage terminase small subunit
MIENDDTMTGGSALVRKIGPLANARHESFCHGLARGLPASVAFVEAGYSANDGNACRLNGNEKVKIRVAELKEIVQKMQNLSSHRVVLTKSWVLEQLIGVVLDARSQDRPDSAGANKALHLLGLELGMYVERQEIGKPGEFEGQTIATKRERVLDIARQLGLGHISERRHGLHDFGGPVPIDAKPTTE